MDNIILLPIYTLGSRYCESKENTKTADIPNSHLQIFKLNEANIRIWSAAFRNRVYFLSLNWKTRTLGVLLRI